MKTKYNQKYLYHQRLPLRIKISVSYHGFFPRSIGVFIFSSKVDLKQIKSSIYDFWMLNMVENNQAMTKKIFWSESFWNISLWKDFPLSEKKLTSLTINTKPFYINRQTYFGRESRALIWSPLSVDFPSKGCVGYRSLGPGFFFFFFTFIYFVSY